MGIIPISIESITLKNIKNLPFTMTVYNMRSYQLGGCTLTLVGIVSVQLAMVLYVLCVRLDMMCIKYDGKSIYRGGYAVDPVFMKLRTMKC